jgi:Resolvase, N terminal domain
MTKTNEAATTRSSIVTKPREEARPTEKRGEAMDRSEQATTQRGPRKGDSRIAVAYLRSATKDHQLSFEAQRRVIDAWAERERVNVVEWHRDPGVSGLSHGANRPALTAALDALKVRDAGVFVVSRRDRLGRDVATALAIEEAVEGSGVRVVSAEEASSGERRIRTLP